jgi:hypothetical protein
MHLRAVHLGLAFVTASMVGLAVAVSPASGEGNQGGASPVELVTATSATGAGPEALKTTDRIARAQITLKNPGAQALEVRPDMEWRRLADASARPVRWLATQTGAAPVNGAFPLAANGTGTFMAEGEFDEAGNYLIGVTVSGGGSTDRRFTLAVTRTVAAVPDTLFVAPKPARIDVDFPRGTTAEPFVVVISAHNAGNDPVPLSPPKIVRVATVNGDTETNAALAAAPTVRAGNCTGELRPKGDCALEINLPAGLSSGRYAVDVAMDGPGGGRTLASQRVDVRLSALWAGILVGLGSLAGYLVVIWRERGRSTLDRRIAAAEARVGINRLSHAAKSPVVRQQATVLLSRVRTIETSIASGDDPTAALAELSGRYEVLVAADQTLARADQGQTRGLFETLVGGLNTTLQADAWTVADVRTKLQRIQSELGVLDGFVAAADNLKAALGDVDSMRDWLPDDKVQLVSNTHDELARALEAIPVDADKGLKVRTDKLEGARQELAGLAKIVAESLRARVKEVLDGTPNRPELKQFGAKLANALRTPGRIDLPAAKLFVTEARSLGLAPAGAALEGMEVAKDSSIPRILPADSALTFDFNPFLFGIGQAVPPSKLRATRFAWTVLTNAIVLIGIGLTGILVLWVPNTSWGNIVDVVTAVLAGAGTRLAVGTLPQANH